MSQLPTAFRANQSVALAELVLRCLVRASEVIDDRFLAHVRRSAGRAFLSGVQPGRLTGRAEMEAIKKGARQQAGFAQSIGCLDGAFQGTARITQKLRRRSVVYRFEPSLARIDACQQQRLRVFRRENTGR
jgi:hypothetical protein